MATWRPPSERLQIRYKQDEDAAGGPDGEDGEETHMCEKCCAQFFSWPELIQHRGVCTEDTVVLIVKESEGTGGPEDSPVGPSPVSSVASSDVSAAESADALMNDNDSLDNEDDARDWDEGLELDKCPSTPPDSGESSSPRTSAVPSTNVTLEILHSTRVAVAQFSQGVDGGGLAASAAIPVILEHLLALQQQQVHQLQLIEQICSQLAVMNRQPTQAASNPASRSLSLPPNPFPSPGIIRPPILPLSGTMPSSVNGHAAVSLSQSVPSQTICGHSTCTSASPEHATASLPTLLPPYTASQTLSPSSQLSLPPSGLLSSSSGLPFLPQSPPSGVIFPNPLASIAATASALDPLAALMKHRKATLPGASPFETKPVPEEPFFKHKCRFCAKVFGSDSALQIHLRSHTGERPFKCNICGNRFSTKGNLKVHFQRHKDKYPHVQMNPFPVPEYLDNVPTSSGIPYGMSVPPEKPVSSWLDSKPIVPTLPANTGLPLPSAVASIGGSSDPVSVTPCVESPYQAECVSVSPNVRGSEARFSPVSESPRSNRETEAQLRPKAPTPDPSASPVSSPGATFSESMQTSETSKLQQLVENIDKKIPDPNQCVLCDRVLSCQSALKMHQRIHTGERPFKCKVCSRAFSTKGNLKTHVGVHRENPPVQVQHSCPICQKRFTNAVVLQQHIRTHVQTGRAVDALQELDGNELADDVSMEEDEEESGAELFFPDSASCIAALENQMRMIDSGFGFSARPRGCKDVSRIGTNDENKPEIVNENTLHVSESSVFLCQSVPEATAVKSPADGNVSPDSREPLGASVKREEAECPTSAQELRGVHPDKLCVKEESPYDAAFQPSRERAAGEILSGLMAATNGEVKGQPPFGIRIAAVYPAACSPGVTSLLGPAPPRRTPKQHNCTVCGKNFSSASALQIHERTHTGEKPFVCSVCGRAFTTKGNLKVHMGTHMWNNVPARRGRRLSVENPMALLGGEVVKFGDMFQKDLATRAVNVDPGFWNRYATAITNSLAMKNNEISVIQNRGVAQVHPLSGGVGRAGGAGSMAGSITGSIAGSMAGSIAGLTKTAVELGSSRHFSMLIDDSKDIGIN